jgi:CBS-domain-containing membrane protein
MFAIYDHEARRFRDTLEQLHKIRSICVEAGSMFQPNALSSAQLAIPNKAIQAYLEMRHLKHREPVCHAYQLMSHLVKALNMDMSIIEAQAYLQEHSLQQMPVINAQHRIVGMLSLKRLLQFIIIDNEQDALVGIVSRGDILRAVMNDQPLTVWS